MQIPLPDKEKFLEIFKDNTATFTLQHFGISYKTLKRWLKVFDVPNKTNQRKIELPSYLTDEQLEMLTGCMLGDGSISKKAIGNCYFSTEHGIAQAEYTKHIFDTLDKLSSSYKFKSPRNSYSQYIGRMIRGNGSYKIITKLHPIFTELEKVWYKRDENGEYVLKNDRRIKIIPQDINLSPRVVAYWFFDDGTNNIKNRNIRLHTNAFSIEEAYLLISELEKLGITQCELIFVNKQPIIKIKPASYEDFLKMVSPFCCTKDMEYKIKFNPKRGHKGENNNSAKLSEKDVLNILQLAKNGANICDIMDLYNISRGHTNGIINGRKWSHISRV